MRILLIPLLLLVCACASERSRDLASEELIVLGDVDPAKSRIQFNSPDSIGKNLEHHLYLVAKDGGGLTVDFEPADLTIKDQKGKLVPYTSSRRMRGHYYLTILQEIGAPALTVNFFIKGKGLQEKLKLNNHWASETYSKLELKKSQGNKLDFKLRVADERGQPLELSNLPEILPSGDCTIEALRRTGSGTWEFSVAIPEGNQILYFSVRADGVYMANLYRHQHVEK